MSLPFQSGFMGYGQSIGASPTGLGLHKDVRAPAATDVLYPLGCRWLYIGVAEYVLMALKTTGGVTSATWALVTTVGGDLNTLTAGTNGVVVPPSSAGNVNINGTTAQVAVNGTIATNTLAISLIGPYTPATYTAHGVLIGEGASSIVATATGTAGQYLVSNGASTDPTFQTATPQLTVVPVAGTSQAMTSNHMYIANSASLTTFTLPTTSAVGDIIQILGSSLNSGGWKVTYTTEQIIWGPAGSSAATTGNAASATAAAQAMEIVCTIANTTWCIVDNSGTITLT